MTLPELIQQLKQDLQILQKAQALLQNPNYHGDRLIFLIAQETGYTIPQVRQALKNARTELRGTA